MSLPHHIFKSKIENLRPESLYKSRKDKDPSKEPDMSDAMHVIRLKGRDNARTPMPWNNGPNGGFTSPGTKPWLRMNDEYKTFSVESEKDDPDSVLSYYKKLIHIRKQHPLMVCLIPPKALFLLMFVDVNVSVLTMIITVLRSLRSRQPNRPQSILLPPHARTMAQPDLL